MSAPNKWDAVKLAGSWAVVGVPALWGVYQVFLKALALFR